MNTLKIAISGLLLVVAGAALAEEVTCESVDGKRKECRMDSRGQVRMVQQLSKADCVEGRTWGQDRQGVWVDDGCRATFEAEHGAPSSVTCESVDNASHSCAMNTEGGVRLVTQHSKADCTEGRTWGTTREGVWVSHGCRAEFQNAGGRYHH